MFQEAQHPEKDKSHLKVIKENISSLEKIRDYLKKNDPDIFNHIHPNDEYRLSRTVEFHVSSQKKYSNELQNTIKNKPYDFSINNQIQGEMLHIYLEIEKEKHLQIILNRASQMVKNGLVNEVQNLLNSGFDPNLKPLQSIGYKETINHIKLPGLIVEEELINDIYISTRQLAKSQKTFFKKITPKETVSPIENIDYLFSLVDKFFK